MVEIAVGVINLICKKHLKRVLYLFVFIEYTTICHAFITPVFAVQSQSEDTVFNVGNYARLNIERVLFHPALYHDVSEIQFDAYFTRPYGLRELDTRSFLLMLPWGKKRFGLSMTSFGGKLYSETAVSCLSVLHVTAGLWITSELTWLPVTISGYRRMSDFAVNKGLFYHISRYELGFRFLNIVSGGDAHTRIGRNRAFQFRAGASLSPAFKIAVGMLQETGFPPLWILENRLCFGGILGLVTEIGANPSQYAFGIEIKLRAVQFVYYLKQHPDLGSTSQFGVSYRFATKRQR